MELVTAALARYIGHSVAVEGKPADVEQQLGVTLPHAVQLLYEEHDGRFNEGGQWWVVWQRDRLVSENRDAWKRGLPKTFFAFGDDGTGNLFCVEIDDGSSEVVRWNWIDKAIERSEGSLDDFIAEWVEDERP